MRKKYQKFFSALRIALAVIFVAVVGVIAGVLGGLISPQVFLPEDIIQLRPIIFEDKVASRPTGKEVDISDIVRTIAPSTGELYRVSKNTEKNFGVDVSPFAKDFLGYALVGTADGWLLLPPSVSRIRTGEIRFIDSEKRVFRMESRVFDSATGVQYAKAILSKDITLRPLQFDASTDIGVSKRVYEIRDMRTGIPFDLTPLGYPRFDAMADAVQSPSELKKRFNATQAFSVEGMPFVTEKKEMIGLATAQGILPMAYVQDALTQVLRSGKIQRPTLSMQYVDLSLLSVGFSKTGRGLIKNGAFVMAQKRVVVLPGPQGAVSLAGGDVIVSINAEILDPQKNISEMIQQYTKGDAVTLEYIRAGEKKTAQVTLQ